MSYQRRWDVITSHRRWNDVILMLCTCWVYLVHRTILRRQFEYCIHNIKLYIELYEKQQNKIHVKVHIHRVLINSRFGVSYSNFSFLTPTFWKVSTEKYCKTPTFSGRQHFTPIFKILVKTLIQFFLFFAVTVIVLSVLGLFRCPIFCLSSVEPLLQTVHLSIWPVVHFSLRVYEII